MRTQGIKTTLQAAVLRTSVFLGPSVLSQGGAAQTADASGDTNAVSTVQ